MKEGCIFSWWCVPWEQSCSRRGGETESMAVKEISYREKLYPCMLHCSWTLLLSPSATLYTWCVSTVMTFSRNVSWLVTQADTTSCKITKARLMVSEWQLIYSSPKGQEVEFTAVSYTRSIWKFKRVGKEEFAYIKAAIAAVCCCGSRLSCFELLFNSSGGQRSDQDKKYNVFFFSFKNLVMIIGSSNII